MRHPVRPTDSEGLPLARSASTVGFTNFARDLPLRAVAAQLHLSGATLSLYERGKRGLSGPQFLQLATLYCAPPPELLFSAYFR